MTSCEFDPKLHPSPFGNAKSSVLYLMSLWLYNVIYSWLSRFSTARGSITGFSLEGPTKVKAYRSFFGFVHINAVVLQCMCTYAIFFSYIRKSMQFTGKYVFMHVFRRTCVYKQFSKLRKYVFEKYDVIQKYEYLFPKYDWSKGKYAHGSKKPITILLDQHPIHQFFQRSNSSGARNQTNLDQWKYFNEPSQVFQIDCDPELTEGVVPLEGIAVLVTEVTTTTELSQEFFEAFLQGQVVGRSGPGLCITGVSEVVRVVNLRSIKPQNKILSSEQILFSRILRRGFS